MPQILFNGQQYNDVNQMPPEVREAYKSAIKAMSNIFADNDHNGMPDVLENATSGSNIQTTYQVVEVNGQVDKNTNDLASNLRPLFEQLAKQADSNIPEEIITVNKPEVGVSENPPEWINQLAGVQTGSEPVIQPVDGKPAQLIILLVLGVILVVALIVAALILFQ